MYECALLILFLVGAMLLVPRTIEALTRYVEARAHDAERQARRREIDQRLLAHYQEEARRAREEMHPDYLMRRWRELVEEAQS